MIRIRMMSISSLLAAVAMGAAACGDSPTGPVEEDPVDRAQEISELVTSASKFQEAQQWPARADSVSDMTAGTDTITDGNEVTTTEWIEETVHYSASANPDEFMMFNPLASVLWPGNLVQGNSIAGGVPNSIPIQDRAPGNIVLAIVSGDAAGSANSFSRTINNFRSSDVIQAMNEILAGYEGGTPARYSYSFEQAHSASQLYFDLGFGYAGPAVEIEGSFSFTKDNAESRMAVRLTQQFYTMVFDDPEGPSGVFGPGVTSQTLSPYTGDGNPITYISSVTYGRVYVLLYESEASIQELESALRFAYAGASGSAETAFNEVMSKTSVSIVQIGGDPQAGLETGAGQTAPDLEKIRSFLTEGANFSADNPGEPISYTIKYLRDASLVRMNNTMEYSVVQRTPISSSTEFTSSRFNLLFKDVLVVSTEDPFGADPGIRVRVYTIDGTSGARQDLWASATPNDDVAWGLEWDAPAGSDQALPPDAWTVPEFELPDDPNLSLYVEFHGAEFDPWPTGWQWDIVYRRYVYDPTQYRWRVAEGEWDHAYTSPPEATLKLSWELKRNGSMVTN